MNRMREVLNDMANNVFRASEGFLQDLKDHYQAAQQQPLRPKRILLVEPEHEYLADSIGKGFQDEGWLVDTFKGNTRLLRFVNPFIWLVYTRENYPDLLLWMNRNTLSPEGVKLLSSLPIKKVLWFLDNPKRVQTTAEELEATDAYFSFDPTYLPYLKDLSGKEGKTLPTGAGIEPLSECRPGQNPPPRQGPALGFMGALGAQRFQAVREFWTRKDPEFVRILDELVDAYLAEPSLSLEERYNASPGRDRLPYSGFVVLYLEERATYLHRLRFLAPLAGQGLVTYGGVEWAHPEWAEPLCHCYSGQTPRYQEDLPRVYYHTQININLFHAQCVNSLNPRVYDVLAAGGFLLTEYRPALEQEFELGRHMVAFSSPDELREKAAYYLAHPDERDAIARAGQQRVLERYTYRQRVRTLCETIR
ncbi:MAG: glycosyltransferase, partial [bacterium]|jgi:hypothetical protein|nr:glycosyltransferase [bacterium]